MNSHTPLNPDDMKMGLPVFPPLDTEKITVGMSIILDAWEDHINARAAAGEDIPYWEGLMMFHNAYKAALDQVARDAGLDRIQAAAHYRAARDTFSMAMDQRIRSGPPPGKDRR